MPFLRKRWPWLLVILFPLLPLWRAVFLGEAIGPFDQIRQMAPWNGSAPDRPFDVLQADAVLQFYPWRDMVFEAWGNMQLPLWNPYQLAGAPLLANSQSAGFYPPHILLGLMHVPTHWAITLLAWFHLALAGLGVMALARRLGATPEGGAIGGVLFSGSAFMLAWTALPSVISTVAWIPWVLYGVYGLFAHVRFTTYDVRDSATPQNRNTATPLSKTSTLQHYNTLAGLSVSTGMMLLAGHLQFAFYGLLAAFFVLLFLFVFALFDKSYKSNKPYPSDQSDPTGRPPQSTIHNPQSTPFRSLLLGVFALAVGGGLAAPQLLPVLEYSKFSHRRNVASEEGYKAYVAGAIAPFELVGLVYPTAVGLPFEFAPDAKPLSQYWPALVKQGANFAEGAIGIGPLALFGLLMFPWRRTPKRAWVPLATLGVLAFLMALGTIVNKPFYFLIPGWSSTGSPGRIGVLFVLIACVLSSVAVSRTYPWKQSLISATLVGAATVATLLIGNFVLGSVQPRFPGLDNEVLLSSFRACAMAIVVGTLIAIAVSTLLAISTRRSADQGTGFSFTDTHVLAQLATYILLLVGIVPSGAPLQKVLSDVNASERSAFINDPWELVVAAPATMPPNTASILRIHDLGGYDSLLHKDTHLFLGYVNGQDPAPPANGNMQFIKPTADIRKLAEAGVSDVYSRAPAFGMVESEQSENGLIHTSIPEGKRIYVEGGPANGECKIVEEGYDHVYILADGPGKLVLKDRLMPGWRAIVGGANVEWSTDKSAMWKSPDGRDVQLWRVVDLPEGKFNVDFVYDPPGLRKGLLVFYACFLFWLATWAEGRRRARGENQ